MAALRAPSHCLIGLRALSALSKYFCFRAVIRLAARGSVSLQLTALSRGPHMGCACRQSANRRWDSSPYHNLFTRASCALVRSMDLTGERLYRPLLPRPLTRRVSHVALMVARSVAGCMLGGFLTFCGSVHSESSFALAGSVPHYIGRVGGL